MLIRMLFIALILAPMMSYADTQSRASLWTMSLNRFQFSDQYRGFLDIQPRITVNDISGGDDNSIDTLLIRGAFGYQLSPKVGIYQGYAVIPTYDPKRVEHRLFQELLAKQDIGATNSLIHRVRFEQRLLEGVDDIAYRLRYFARFTRPLNRNLSLAINEEVFLNINDADEGPQTGFGQNRLFFGLNYRLSKKLAFEVGYQNQYIEGRAGATDVVNHIAFVGVQTNFSFIDKKN